MPRRDTKRPKGKKKIIQGSPKPIVGTGPDPLLLYGLAVSCFIYAVYCSTVFQDKVSLVFFTSLSFVLVCRANFPSWKYELGSQGKLSLIHLVPGIVAGGYGIVALSGKLPDWRVGIPLQAFAFWAVLNAFPKNISGVLPPNAAPVKAGISTPSAQVWMNLFTMLIASQVAFFFVHTTLALAILGMAALLIGTLVIRGGEVGKPQSLASENKWLLAILILAFMMRVPFIGTNLCGLQNDESNMVMSVISVANGEIHSPFWTSWASTATLLYFVTAAFFKIIGNALIAARLTSALAGVLAVWLFFRWCRFYFSAIPSLAVAFFFAISWWALYHSLSPFHGIFTVLFTIASFYFLEKAFQGGRRIDFWWMGICVAVCIETYVPGRLTPLMVFLSLFGFLLLGRLRFFTAYWSVALLSLLAFFWFIGPFLMLCYSSPEIMFGRAQELNISTMVHQKGDWMLPVESFWKTFLAFLQDPGIRNDIRFNLPHNPLFDPFMGLFLGGGLVLTLLGIGGRLSWVILPGLLLGMGANAMAKINDDLDYFNAVRCFILFPFALLMMARFLEWVLALKLPGLMPKGFALAGLFLILGGSLAYNVDKFYFSWAQDQDQWEQLGFNHVSIAQLAEKYASECRLMIFIHDWGNTEEVVTQQKIQATHFNEDTPLPLLNRVDRDVLFMMGTWECREFQKRIHEVYPQAQWVTWQNKFNFNYFYLVRVSKADIEKAQAGKSLLDSLP